MKTNIWIAIPLNYDLVTSARMIDLFEHNEKEFYLVLMANRDEYLGHNVVPSHWELWRRDNNGKSKFASPVKIFDTNSFNYAENWSNDYINQRKAYAMVKEPWLTYFEEKRHVNHNNTNKIFNEGDNMKNIKTKNTWKKVESCESFVIKKLNPKAIYIHSSGEYFLVKIGNNVISAHWELWKNYKLTRNGLENEHNLVMFNPEVRLNDAKWWFNNSQYNIFNNG